VTKPREVHATTAPPETLDSRGMRDPDKVWDLALEPQLDGLDAGGATTYETLQRRVWGDRGGANPETIRNAIRKLRGKLGDDARNPKYILSERGLGYRMPGPEDG
jgi:hypothetical protein